MFHRFGMVINALVATMLLAVLVGCGGSSRTPELHAQTPGTTETLETKPPQPSALPVQNSEITAVASGYDAFGIDLLKNITSTTPQQNIFISPLSAAVALSMTYNGARGQTATEFGNVLGVSQLSLEQVNQANQNLAGLLNYEDSTLTISSANAIWMRNEMKFKQPFLDRVQSAYRSRLTRADFSNPSTKDSINGWVSNQTRGKIIDLIESIPDSAMMYLINALYFKGTWVSKFDSANTRPDTFTVADGSTKQVQMMNQSGEFPYYADSQVQIIKLPYVTPQARGETNHRLFMYILLPDSAADFAQFVQSLSAVQWQRWSSLAIPQRGTIMPPRFRLEYKQELNEHLQQLGLRLAFDAFNADFREMWEQATTGDIRVSGADTNLFVSKVLQKTFVDVNEVGTEAAAATSVEMAVTTTAIIEEPVPFVMEVDHPFVCAIVDDLTQAVLFLGAIVAPN